MENKLEQNEEEIEDTEEDKEEERGLKYAPWIGAGFGLIAAGYLARYLLGLFSSMDISISPNVGNLLINIGIIVTIVSISAEIITTLINKK